MWPTLKKDPPAVPEKGPMYERNALTKLTTSKEQKVKKPREWKVKKNAIELMLLFGDLDNLTASRIGTWLH